MSNVVIKCFLCEKYFTSMELLEEHEHSKILHSCSKCDKRFTNSYHLVKHTDAHRRNAHSCKFCGEICNDKTDIYIHLTTVHKGIDKWVCGICDKVYNTSSILKRHVRVVHVIEYPPMLDKAEFFCSIHSEQKDFDHDELKNELLETDMSRTFSEPQEDEMSEAEIFLSREYLDESAHRNNPHNPEFHPNSGGILTCSVCEKVFTNPQILLHHEDAHKRKKHSCKFCGKIRNDGIYLYIHLSTIHNNVYKSVCHICGREFDRPRTLKCHIAYVHTDRLESILEKAKSFCTIHSRQRYFDHRELQNELTVLDISQAFSETQENDVIEGDFNYTGQKEKTAVRYSTDNPEDQQSVSNTAKELETANFEEQTEPLDLTIRRSLNPNKN